MGERSNCSATRSRTRRPGCPSGMHSVISGGSRHFYQNDAQAKREGLNPLARLIFHRERTERSSHQLRGAAFPHPFKK